MNIELLTACLAFATIATLYSSVGHAGASGYLAVMALLSFNPVIIKPTSLVLNIIVAAIASYKYISKGFFDKKIFYPLILVSVPAAYIGGALHLNENVFKLIAGAFLVSSGLVLLYREFSGTNDVPARRPPLLVSLTIGSLIGFLSGLVGVGGGIFLSPIMIVFHWTEIKKTSGIAALFILINSISALAGNPESLKQIEPDIVYWVFSVILGAVIGSYLGTIKLNKRWIILCLFLVLFSAGIKFLLVR